MNKSTKLHFEASVCRESDMHGWRFFITWKEDGEWVSSLYDATPDNLAHAIRQCIYKYGESAELHEVATAYFHACELNAKVAA